MIHTSTVLIIHNKKILLFHRDDIPNIPDPNMWSLIGGYIDEGEDYEQATLREAFEETNLKLKNIELVLQEKIIGSDLVNDRDTAVYVSYIDDEDAKDIKLGNEGQELRFFSFDELRDLELSGNINYLYVEHFDQLKRLIEK